MAEHNQGVGPKNDRARSEAGEDDEMRAARRELKQSSISDPPLSSPSSGHGSPLNDKADNRIATPSGGASDGQNKDLKAKVSPKKKRAHDQLDTEKRIRNQDAISRASTDSAKDRTSRLEPEKKRHRDKEEFQDAVLDRAVGDTESALGKGGDDIECIGDKGSGASAQALAASGFSKLTRGTSASASHGVAPETAHESEDKCESPLSPPHMASGELRSTPDTSPPKLTFAGNGGVSPFAVLSSSRNSFASIGGGGFASAFSAIKPLTTFSVSGSVGMHLNSGKTTRPFGAPDSESDMDDEIDEPRDLDCQTCESLHATSPERDTEDKRRTKLQKVEVDDGEAGEVSVVSVRAKLFSLDKEAGWKERGAGMLKINVPRNCVEFDESGAPIPGSFDASGLQVEDVAVDGAKGHQVVRLIMRQDQTHRVILNTVIVPAMQFQEKTSLKSVGILFTALEGQRVKPVSITMRMSVANAKAFMKEIEVVQRELRCRN